MTQVTQPRFDIPIGTVQVIGGQTVVIPSREYIRFFGDMVIRVGGVGGASSGDLEASMPEDQPAEKLMFPIGKLRGEVDSLPVSKEMRDRYEPSQYELMARLLKLEAAVSSIEQNPALK